MIHYGVAKAAQAALARGLAERTRGTRVTVNTVLAGPTRSEGVAAFVEGSRNSAESRPMRSSATSSPPPGGALAPAAVAATDEMPRWSPSSRARSRPP